MFISKDLRAERASLIAKAHEIITKDGVTQEDHAAFDAYMAEADKIEAHYTRIEAADAAQAALNEIIGETAERKHISFDHERHNTDVAKRGFLAQVKQASGVTLNKSDSALLHDYRATAGSVGTPAAGGYLVEPVLMKELLVTLKEYGGVRDVARILTTDKGNPLNWDLCDDTANVAVIVAENTSLGTAADLVFSQKTLGAFKYTTGIFLCSTELLQDSAFDLEAFIKEAFGTRMGRGTNIHYTTGNGTSQPEGIVTGSVLGTTGASGQTTSAILGDFFALEASIDPAYRKSPNVAYMMNDSTLQVLRRMVDTTGRPLWQPSLQGGVADTFNGYKVVINQSMPNMGASAKAILFGDFSNFVIRDVMDMQLAVLRERYADTGQVGFVALMRTDSKMLSAGRPVKWYANAAS